MIPALIILGVAPGAIVARSAEEINAAIAESAPIVVQNGIVGAIIVEAMASGVDVTDQVHMALREVAASDEELVAEAGRLLTATMQSRPVRTEIALLDAEAPALSGFAGIGLEPRLWC